LSRKVSLGKGCIGMGRFRWFPFTLNYMGSFAVRDVEIASILQSFPDLVMRAGLPPQLLYEWGEQTFLIAPSAASRFSAPFQQLSWKRYRQWLVLGGLLLAVIAVLIYLHASLPHEGNELPTHQHQLVTATPIPSPRAFPAPQEDMTCSEKTGECVIRVRDIPYVRGVTTLPSGPTALAPPTVIIQARAVSPTFHADPYDFPVLWPIQLVPPRSSNLAGFSVLAFLLWQASHDLPSPPAVQCPGGAQGCSFLLSVWFQTISSGAAPPICQQLLSSTFSPTSECGFLLSSFGLPLRVSSSQSHPQRSTRQTTSKIFRIRGPPTAAQIRNRCL